MFEDASLESNILNFKEIISDIEVMDANTLIEEDLCSLLLMTLCTSCTTFHDTLFYAHKDLT